MKQIINSINEIEASFYEKCNGSTCRRQHDITFSSHSLMMKIRSTFQNSTYNLYLDDTPIKLGFMLTIYENLNELFS